MCLLTAILAAVLTASDLIAESSGTAILKDKFGFTTHRSASGRFVVAGPEETVNMAIGAWADELAVKVERILGIAPSFEKRAFRLILRDDPSGSDIGRVEYTQEVSRGVLVQRLVLTGITNAVSDDCEEVFCRLMLNGYVFPREYGGRANGDVAGPQVPRWLCVGLSQNLRPSTRARNAAVILKKWNEGRSGDLKTILAWNDTQHSEPIDSAMCGVFTGWLLALPGKEERFGRIFGRVAAGEPMDVEWFAGVVPDCENAADVHDKWDLWMIRERHTIRELGGAGEADVRKLKAMLALYRGESGIPIKGEVYAPISLKELIAERKSEWIRDFVDSKSASLRFLVIGRSQEFAGVVQNYCDFLEGLKSGQSEKELNSLLKKAEKFMSVFEKRLMGYR